MPPGHGIMSPPPHPPPWGYLPLSPYPLYHLLPLTNHLLPPLQHLLPGAICLEGQPCHYLIEVRPAHATVPMNGSTVTHDPMPQQAIDLTATPDPTVDNSDDSDPIDHTVSIQMPSSHIIFHWITLSLPGSLYEIPLQYL
jgi:hypothetical protein